MFIKFLLLGAFIFAGIPMLWAFTLPIFGAFGPIGILLHIVLMFAIMFYGICFLVA